MLYVVSFVLGCVAGSFIGLCIYRLPRGQSVLFPSSRCPDCGRGLRVRQMVPVISFCLLKGKCGYCNNRISPIYPITEFLMGAMFLVLMRRFGPGLKFIKLSILLSILTAAGFIDFEHHIIPDGLVMVGTLFGMVFLLVAQDYSFMYYITGALLGGGILLAINLASGGGMGGGDIKLMTVIGLFLGWSSTLLVLFLAFVIGGLAATLLLLSGRGSRKDAVPFGPFLGLAAAVTVFYGQRLIELYLSFYS